MKMVWQAVPQVSRVFMLNYRARYTSAAPSAYTPLKHVQLPCIHTRACERAHATGSSPRNPDPRRYSNYYGVSAFPWRSARTFGHAKLPVCSRNVVTRADVHFHYRLIELIFWARAESTRSRVVFPWRATNVRKYDDPCRKYKYLTREWNQCHAVCILDISWCQAIRRAKFKKN